MRIDSVSAAGSLGVFSGSSLRIAVLDSPLAFPPARGSPWWSVLQIGMLATPVGMLQNAGGGRESPARSRVTLYERVGAREGLDPAAIISMLIFAYSARHPYFRGSKWRN